jgi:hypothetical protein
VARHRPCFLAQQNFDAQSSIRLADRHAEATVAIVCQPTELKARIELAVRAFNLLSIRQQNPIQRGGQIRMPTP